jgi:hypothetical protein
LIKMPRTRQLVFVVSMLSLSWLGMMIVHELGHIAGAMLTGGHVQRVVLHPAAISRTDVAPNPHPALVVWMGPVTGVLLPSIAFLSMARRRGTSVVMVGFFAGFCLIANGAYISLGAFDRVGDCGEMLRTGTPLWVMLAFGAAAIPAGLVIWHRLGSLGEFWRQPERVSTRLLAWTVSVTVCVIVAELLAHDHI